MLTPSLTIFELDQEKPHLLLWKESVGKVFKLTSKSYGSRTVTYTQVKAVKETEPSGSFEIEVSCAEIIARVINSKRAHSSVCKDGVIYQNEQSSITPNGFGEDCRLQEFEKISEAILAHTTMSLDAVTQASTEEENESAVPIDLPHLRLTDLEASLVRHSPFLMRDVYFLSANSRRAGLELINQELQRAARNSRLTDACDPLYVAKKNDAVISLRKKLNSAGPEASSPAFSAPVAPAIKPSATLAKRDVPPPPPPRAITGPSVGAQEPKNAGSTGACATLGGLEKDRLATALLGKPSGINLSWERQNPCKEGAVFRAGKECGLLEFMRWAHVSGRAVAEEETAGKKVRSYFLGSDDSYLGPDREGIYPLFKLEA